MKNIKTFKEFINESSLNEDKMLTPAELIKMSPEYNAASYIKQMIEQGDNDIADSITEMCKFFKEDPKNVFSIDENQADPSDGTEDLYEWISENVGIGSQDMKFGKLSGFRYNKKLNIVESNLDEQVNFYMYWYTAKSKFK
jgi:hypothetical protein